VTLHDVDYDSLTPRLAEMFVLLVHARFEEFLTSFLESHVDSKLWDPRGDSGLFEYVLNNLGLVHSANGEAERETIAYYRLARNAISHATSKIKRLENQRGKVQRLLNVTKDYLPPKKLGSFDYGDFFMFTRAVKRYAAIICEAGRPSDSGIADLIAPDIRSLNRFRNKPQRFRNGVRQFLQMKYHMDAHEADRVIDRIIGR
jgi:hypothetical protein